MAIAYGDDTIVVTGGSQDDPFTMDDLENDGVVGTYVTPGGYANREFAVSKHLVIGSEDASTFFDLTNSIIKMDSGYTLTVYTTALRGGKMGPTFAEQKSGLGTIAFVEETVCKSRLENIRKLYIERAYTLSNSSGQWVASGPAPRIVAVSSDDVVT